ncbi:MAG: hypothetical protein V2I43_21490, partial [Parvularcula sp.]|nr:hypothetical protein [Parvularcula sp.]
SPSTEEDFFRYGATGHRLSKEDNSDAFDEIMRNGAALPLTGRVPVVTTRTIAAYPEAYADLREAFAPDFRLLEAI